MESQLSSGKAWVYQDPEFLGDTNFLESKISKKMVASIV